MSGELSGKTALITGGSRGIGRGIVDAYVQAGAQVMTCGRTAPGDLPRGVNFQELDISTDGAIDVLAGRVEEAFGKLDVLVNNAGIQIEKNVVDTTDEDFNQLMNINVRAVFQACRRFIPVMAAGGGGAIINIGSISATHADPGLAIYNASKAFVAGLTRSIAVDHGAAGVRCNAICPGWINTGMADAIFDMAPNPDAARADALARHPAGRLGLPSDIAAAAVWLASDAAVFVTGQTLTVDGGLVAASPLQPELV